jgi:signal transduction histidine kinase
LGLPHRAQGRLRRWWDDGGGLATYVARMRLVRPSIWLTAVGVAAVAVVGSFGAAGGQPDRRGLDAVAIGLLLVGPAALALRDRWPVGAVVASMAAACVFIGRGHPFGPIFLSVVVALFSAVQARRRVQTWVAAAVGYLAFFVALRLDPRAEDVGWVHWALVAGWLVVVLAVSDVVRVQRDQAEERARAAEEEHQRRVGEQRLGLAQELHDVLAHNISLINVQASVALHLLDDQPERARPALTAIKDASHESLHELRTALDTLRRGEEAPRAPAPRLADLDELIDGVRASGLDVRIERPNEMPPLPEAVELAAYRIVQEALTNVTRHASARTVTVRVAHDDGATVEVIDDGVGGTAPVGNGIIGMRERAAALGGTVETGPRTGGGFRVVAHLPVRS